MTAPRFQDVHWSDLIPHSDQPEPTDLALTEMERRRREAVWELFKSELVFLLDHLMVLKHVSCLNDAETSFCSSSNKLLYYLLSMVIYDAATVTSS